MKKLCFACLAILILLINTPAAYAEPDDINAPSYILIDPVTGQVLAEKNADEKMYPASTTKIMTAIVALEKGNMNQLMTASAKAIDPGDGGMHIGINEGEQIVMEDLLNAMLIKSANDTANIIAENIGPTYDDFIDSMNKKAAELGAVNTHFVNPHGMHDKNHYTTVRDMSKIARYAMSIDKFREIVKKTKYDMKPTNKHEQWDPIYTINRLLTNFPQYKSDYFTAIGVKSGYTSQAGNNLVSAAVNNKGMELLAVVFGVRETGPSSDVYACTKKLLEYGFTKYSLQTIMNGGEVIKSISVKDAAENTPLELITENSLSAVLPTDQDISKLEKNTEYFKTDLSAPVSKGEVLGSIEYKKDGVVLGKVNLVAIRSIEKSSKAVVQDKLQSAASNLLVHRIFITFIIVILGFMILRFVLRRISRAVNSRS